MPIDLKLNFITGDLAVAPNKDLDRAVGQTLVEQRIKIRLKIVQGQWTLDPTGGLLGSRLVEALRLPLFRAQTEIPLLVHEALAPMDDILVSGVEVDLNADDNKSLDIRIAYNLVDNSGQTTQEDLATTITLSG